MSVLDLSNYDFQTFDAQCLKDAGVERIIFGCWNQGQTLGMLRGARSVGIAAEDFYTFVYYGLSWEQREVDNALYLAATEGGIKRIWIDCEATFTDWPGDLDTEAPGMTPGRRVALTQATVERIRAAGLQPCIYTGGWWWPSKMANSTAFADLPLWVSDYGTNNPDYPRPPVREVAFGGWTTVAAHQYSSSIVVCGRERDHNYWFMEEEMTDPRVDEILKALGGEARLAIWNANGNDLLLGYELEQQKLAAVRADLDAHLSTLGGNVEDHEHESGKVIR